MVNYFEVLMKKILYYFPEKNTNMYLWQRIHFIDELEHYNMKIKSFNPFVESRNWNEANEMLLDEVRDGSISR